MTLTSVRILLAACAGALALGIAPASGAATISIADTNCSDYQLGGTAGNRTLTCVPMSAPPPTSGAPTGCTLVASPASLSAAGLVTLTASCSGGGTPSSYAWTGGVAATTSVNTQAVSVSATTTFAVTPSNSSGSGNQATATVTVGAAPPPPPVSGSCGSAGIVDVGSLQFTTPTFSSGFGGNVVAVATLQIPSGRPTTTNTLAVYEQSQTTAVWRRAWLSKSRCDMSATLFPSFQQGLGGMTFNYTIGGSDPSAVIMQPGETWYLMVVNQYPTGASTCPSGTCEIGIKWYPPI